jgi:pilus assembly protein CpaF
VSIRKFQRNYFSLDALVAAGSMPSRVAHLLRGAIRDRETVIISGGTGSGKTTLANALANLIPPDERIGVIESTAEIQIEAPNVFRFEARREQPGLPPISQRELLQFSLRHRPDRLFVGEVRGAEAFDLLQALNTGHAGSLTTLHANSAEDALDRLAELALMASTDMPYRSIQTRIGRLIRLVVHTTRDRGDRRVSEVLNVHGFDPDAGYYCTEMLYQFQTTKEAYATSEAR